MHNQAWVREHWDTQSDVIKKIFQHGMAEYVKGIADWWSAFQLTDRFLRCIDEGCPGGVHLAGSGILLGVEEAAKIGQTAGVTAVTSHQECGAATLAARQAGQDPAQSDEYGQQFAAELARRLGVSYCHLPISEMARPAGRHIARVVYYDGTGRVDPARAVGLPAGFVISRRYLTTDYARRECEIAVRLALGDHGFGILITPQEPLLIILLGHPTDAAFSLEPLRAEVAHVAQRHSGRVRVDGTVAPFAKV